jgi:hypothetical protein
LAEDRLAEAPAVISAEVPELPPEPAPPSPIGFEPSDAVLNAVHAQRRAEHLHHEAMRRQAEQQRQQAQSEAPPRPMTIEEQIEAAPLSDKRKAFLKAHPELAAPQNQKYTQRFYDEAVEFGLTDDSDEQHEYILRGVQGHLARLEQMRAQARTHVAPRASLAQEEALPPAPSVRSDTVPSPAKRPSLPMSAPVSREVPNVSNGQRRSTEMSLTEEERQIARLAIVDRPDMPKLTNAQKEYIYWKEREKYRAMVRDGSYSEQKGR